MAHYTLPAPGKVVDGEEIGPCVNEDCGHKDCAITRSRAASACPYCGQPIGYEKRFVYLDAAAGLLAHAVCHYEAVGA